MLKRYQVLLDEWLADFAKARSDKYDASFSETIRIGLCVYYGTMISELYPELKYKFTPDKVAPILKKYTDSEESEEEKHKFISEVYYETRKAMEYYAQQQAKDLQPASKA